MADMSRDLGPERLKALKHLLTDLGMSMKDGMIVAVDDFIEKRSGKPEADGVSSGSTRTPTGTTPDPEAERQFRAVQLIQRHAGPIWKKALKELINAILDSIKNEHPEIDVRLSGPNYPGGRGPADIAAKGDSDSAKYFEAKPEAATKSSTGGSQRGSSRGGGSKKTDKVGSRG